MWEGGVGGGGRSRLSCADVLFVMLEGAAAGRRKTDAEQHEMQRLPIHHRASGELALLAFLPVAFLIKKKKIIKT